MSSDGSSSGWRARHGLALAAACACLLWIIHGAALTAPFIADDYSHVVGVAGKLGPAGVRASLTGGWYGIGPPWYWRPLAVLSFALDARLWGTNASGFHLFNALAFVATALLLARIVALAWTKVVGDAARANRAGVVAALCFCAFPGFPEAVGWISNRDGPAAVLFALLATWLQLRAGARVAWLAAGAYALALTSKELAVTLGVLPVLAVGVTAFAAVVPVRARWRAFVRGTAPYVAIVIAYFAARLAMFGTIATGVPVWQSAEMHGDGGVLLLRNVLAWLYATIAPFGDELIGTRAPVFAAVRIALLVTIVALALRGALRARTFAVLLVGACALATILLGPIVFVTLKRATLENSRFVPLVALPICALLGVVFAHARGRAAIGALAALLALDVSLGAAQSGALALAAHDFEGVRLATRDVSRDLQGDAPAAPVVVLTNVPTAGLAAFPLANALPYVFRAPFGDGSVTLSQLSRDELRLAHCLPEVRPYFAAGWAVLDLGGDPAPVKGWRQSLAQRLYAAPRIHANGAMLLRPPSARTLDAPLQLERDTLAAHAVDAFDVAAIRVESGAAAGAVAALVLHGARGSVTLDATGAGDGVVSTEVRREAAALGRLADVHAVATDGRTVDARLTLLPALPALVMTAPASGATIAADRPIEFRFAGDGPAFERVRIHVVPALESVRTSDVIPKRDASGALAVTFDGSMANGRKTTIDWRVARASATAGRVRILAEGIVGEGADEHVVARSALVELTIE